jgi:hypothetical protein
MGDTKLIFEASISDPKEGFYLTVEPSSWGDHAVLIQCHKRGEDRYSRPSVTIEEDFDIERAREFFQEGLKLLRSLEYRKGLKEDNANR